MDDDNWAGSGFSGTAIRARRTVDAVNALGHQALKRRTRRIEVTRLPSWGEAQPGWALSLPQGQHAVIHFYGPDGSYLRSTVVRSGGIAMVWEGTGHWRAEAIPEAFDTP